MRGNHGIQVRAALEVRSIPACAGEPNGLVFDYPAWGVYPRVCGGTLAKSMIFCSHSGLSPRVRGNRNPIDDVMPKPRSIPACAGEPPARRRRDGRQSVYPRVCGGTRVLRAFKNGSIGLSPRVRGNPCGGAQAYVFLGSIPACAGEPSTRIFSRASAWVYPRVCGGTHLIDAQSLRRRGLSPRVRGNRARRGACNVDQGSIPACAGEP